ncbi:MAG TPA: ABC transporter substrate-binding protein [Aeromicrobium sp.]|nr:ABC transporter substrate-binding protein [Aeromicrobium sp.]
MTKKLSALVIVLLMASLAACGDYETTGKGSDSTPQPALSELEPLKKPKEITGPSTAVLRDRDVEVVESTEKAKLPAKVVSHLRGGDKTVTVTDTSRIVAFDMAGSIAGTLWGLGLGDNLVARDISTEFPGSEKLPLITSEGHAVNAEAVMAQKPTVIITDGSMGPRDVVEQLADTGVPVIFVENDPSFAGAAQLAKDVGQAVGLVATGKKLADRIEAEIAEVRTEIERFAPTNESEKLRVVFLYVRGNSGVYYLFGKEAGVSSLLDGLGAFDVAEELGWRAMQPLTDEAMVKADPDLILVMTHGLDSAGGVDGLLAEKPAIALTTAGKNKRIVDMADGDILSFGPRSAMTLEALARAIYVPQD